jgi:hypothetical protein
VVGVVEVVAATVVLLAVLLQPENPLSSSVIALQIEFKGLKNDEGVDFLQKFGVDAQAFKYSTIEK